MTGSLIEQVSAKLGVTVVGSEYTGTVHFKLRQISDQFEGPIP
jgi:hypothetical protein